MINESILVNGFPTLDKFASFNSIYSSSKPFPHLVIDSLWKTSFLKLVEQECKIFTDWNSIERFYGCIGKRACNKPENFPLNTNILIQLCNSNFFLEALETLTGEKGLIPDPYYLGGGIHSSVNQGFLKMHIDFDWHERMKVYRRLNLLIYLNSDWQSSWGGDLIFASRTNTGDLDFNKTISPTFNKTVIFTTTDKSFHGHPYPMNLPEGFSRNSIALYYYLAKNPIQSNSKRQLGTHYQLSPKELEFIKRKYPELIPRDPSYKPR